MKARVRAASESVEAETASRPLDPEFLQAALAIHRHLELESQLRDLVRILADWSGARHGFAFARRASQRGWDVVGSTLEDDDVRLQRIARVGPMQAKSMVPEEPVAADGAGVLAASFRQWGDDVPARSWTSAVRGPSGQCHGIVQLWLEADVDASTEDRLEALLQEVQVAVAHSDQVATMQQLIIKDDTAHCFNRRYFEEFLPEELSRASRFRAPLSLIFLDMDGLKGINTAFGHSRGSRSLLEVSVRIRGKIRKFDKLFRFGGDEFCIVLPETEWHGAMEVAERVREAIEAQPFLVREVGGDGVLMTASLGIAAYPLHARNKQDLVQLADQAMQTIKRSTKNGVAVAEVHGQEG